MSHDPDIDVRRLRLSPGDVVIVTVPEFTSDEVARHIASNLKRALDAAGHGDVPVALAQSGTEISVLGHNEPGAMTTTEGGAPRHSRRRDEGPSVVTPILPRS